MVGARLRTGLAGDSVDPPQLLAVSAVEAVVEQPVAEEPVGSRVRGDGNRRSRTGMKSERATATATRATMNATSVAAIAGRTVRHMVPARMPAATANMV